MKCPYCGNPKTEVVAAAYLKDGKRRRYRKCPKCKRNFRTYEEYSIEGDNDGIRK